MKTIDLPIPSFFEPEKVGKVWRVKYEEIAKAALQWAKDHKEIQPAAKDDFRVCLIAVDVQNTFCIPDFELYVGGRSGSGAVDDNRRLCEFIYRNLHHITQIVPTMDTHQAMQIFHGIFFVNEKGEHPGPYTVIEKEDIENGVWRFNTLLSENLQKNPQYVQRHIQHYTGQLSNTGKFALMIWPYHAMLGGIGHALVSAVEEAIFFHTFARYSQADVQIKGRHPLTEHYSVFGPEVSTDPDGKILVEKNQDLFAKLYKFDALVIAGQAKSHCVAWTIADLLDNIMARDRKLVEKVYLLEDCTSPVVVPGGADFSDEADAAFRRFKDAGMNVVRSTEPLQNWPRVMGEALG